MQDQHRSFLVRDGPLQLSLGAEGLAGRRRCLLPASVRRVQGPGGAPRVGQRQDAQGRPQAPGSLVPEVTSQRQILILMATAIDVPSLLNHRFPDCKFISTHCLQET